MSKKLLITENLFKIIIATFLDAVMSLDLPQPDDKRNAYQHTLEFINDRYSDSCLDFLYK